MATQQWLLCPLLLRGHVSTHPPVTMSPNHSHLLAAQIADYDAVQPISNPLSNPPATSTPTTGQPPLRPPPIPASSMTSGPQTSSAQSTPTSDISSNQAKPTTPKASTLSAHEQERVAALLHLNALILRELQNLQTAGAASAPTQPSPQQQGQSKPSDSSTAAGEAHKSPTAAGTTTTPTTTTPTPQTPKLTKPSAKLIYDNYLKRLQVNIAYLLALSQVKPVPPHPLAMEPPPDAWSLPAPGELSDSEREEAEERGKEVAKEFREAYQKLKELWPNYKPPQRGQQMIAAQQQQQQQAQQALKGQSSQPTQPVSGAGQQGQGPAQMSAPTGSAQLGQSMPQAPPPQPIQ